MDFAIQHAKPGLAERGKCLAEIELVQLRIERAGQPGIRPIEATLQRDSALPLLDMQLRQFKVMAVQLCLDGHVLQRIIRIAQRIELQRQLAAVVTQPFEQVAGIAQQAIGCHGAALARAGRSRHQAPAVEVQLVAFEADGHPWLGTGLHARRTGQMAAVGTQVDVAQRPLRAVAPRVCLQPERRQVDRQRIEGHGVRRRGRQPALQLLKAG